MNNNFIIDENTALILEGGGMRGTFTSGVLDNLLDKGIDFPLTVGVSAGACNGLSYMSKQRGRARRSNIDLYDEYRYVGLKYLFTQRNIMDFKLLFKHFQMKFALTIMMHFSPEKNVLLWLLPIA